MNGCECPGCHGEQKHATGGFVTNAKSEYILEGDSLEKHIIINLNAKHKNYNKYAIALANLLDAAKKESGLVTYREGL